MQSDIEIAGHRYEILFGADVSRPDARNGVFIEMNELGGSGLNPIIFAFRSNVSLEISISMYREDVALQVLKRNLPSGLPIMTAPAPMVRANSVLS